MYIVKNKNEKSRSYHSMSLGMLKFMLNVKDYGILN